MAFDLQLKDNGAGSFDVALRWLQYLDTSSIAPGEAFGTPSILTTLDPSSITSAEALGTAEVVPRFYVDPTGIASQEAVGSPTVALFIPLSFEHYVARVDPDAYRGELIGPAVIGELAGPSYLGQLAASDYRGSIDPEGDDMFALVAGDLSPSFTATLKNAETGAVVDLTTATGVEAKFKVGESGAVTTAAAAVVNAASGIVRYDWASGDTATAGRMYLRFVATFPVAKPATYPSDGTWYEFEISE